VIKGIGAKAQNVLEAEVKVLKIQISLAKLLSGYFAI
jgi:hypothetical protein